MKVCEAAEALSSTSLAAEMVSVETWDFVSELKIPSFVVYPSLVVVGGFQITPVIWAGMSDKLHRITWSFKFTVYKFCVAGDIVATRKVGD